MDSVLTVIGGGLAGSEAAWQAAERGIPVRLFEMRPYSSTGAHTGPYLAELVCSNSLGSNQLDRASGLLKEELRRMGSLLLGCAEDTAVPAGGALAVDREAFAQRVTAAIEAHPNIELVRQEVTKIPATPTVVASGPLTSPSLSHAVQILTGQQHLYFYDAIAPIVTLGSLNFDVVYRASRYGKGEQEQGDYVNCPMTEDGYAAFVDALIHAERIELKEFERELAPASKGQTNLVAQAFQLMLAQAKACGCISPFSVLRPPQKLCLTLLLKLVILLVFLILFLD